MAARKRSARAGIPEDHRRAWNRMYQETRYDQLPWFSTRPYPWVAESARIGTWRAGTRLLDIGCGAGTNSLFLARSGFKVTGIDLAEGAIQAARARAKRQGLQVDFRAADVLNLPFPDGHFGGAIDIGCFHTLPVDLRRGYAREVGRVLHPRRVLAIAWVAREAKQPEGPPHRPSVEEAASALEEEFLFLRTEFRSSDSWRGTASGLPAYCAHLGRRSFERPPAR